jgi:phosphate transport system protein
LLPRIHFQQQLAELKDKLLAMAALAQQAVESAVDAYLQRDKGLCQYVKQNETAINTAQRELDEMAYELLAKEQPMAIDLRFILAVIKINGDLERIGDQSMGMVRAHQGDSEADEVDLPVDFAAMGEFAGRMIRSAVQALLEGDARLADTVREMDDEIDRMNRRAHADLLQGDPGEAAVYAAGDERHPGVAQPGADCGSRIEYRHRCHFLDSRRGCAAPVEHVDGLNTLGDGVGDCKDLRGMFVEHEVIVAKMRTAHVPVEVLGLQIEGEGIGQQGIEHAGKILDLFRIETVRNVDFGCFRIFMGVCRHRENSFAGRASRCPEWIVRACTHATAWMPTRREGFTGPRGAKGKELGASLTREGAHSTCGSDWRLDF